MKEARRKRDLIRGASLLAAFGLWTVLIQTVDVRPAGPDGSRIGLAAFNIRFHSLTGVHMALYTLTDWLGLVPVGVCLFFAGVGLRQLIGRKSLLKVDPDILLLGVHYILVISGYLFFEAVPINYRPVLINGVLEASYPSSTTLLTLSVMPTLELQARRRVSGAKARGILIAFSRLFSALMVLGRTISGVHWASDIIGAVLLAAGLFTLYRSGAAAADRKTKQTAPKGPIHGIE